MSRYEIFAQHRLSKVLTELKTDSITQTVYAEVPPRVEDALTKLGASLQATLEPLTN